MKQFNQMGIEPTLKSFTGDKIKIERILNIEITVIDYLIEKSNFPEKGDGNRLCLQIKYNNELRVIFSGSAFLKHMISRVNSTDFPFTTIIKKVNDHYEFS